MLKVQDGDAADFGCGRCRVPGVGRLAEVVKKQISLAAS